MDAADVAAWTKWRGGGRTACAFAFVARAVAGTRCDEHVHPCAEIVHVGRSAGVLIQGGISHVFAPGAVFLYQPGAPHAIASRRDGDHLCIGVAGAAASAMRPGLWAGCSSLDRLFTGCRAALAGPAASRQRRLDQLADLILCDLGELPPLTTLDALSPARRAREIIDADPARELPLRDLAEMTGVSVDHLRHVFRREHGVAPHAYRLRRRLEMACALLDAGAVGVAEVAERCGFADAFYFSRLFARTFAMPPSAWAGRAGRTSRRRAGG